MLIYTYTCTKFPKSIFDGFEVIERNDFHTKPSKGRNFAKSVNGVTIFVLSTLSDGDPYLYQV